MCVGVNVCVISQVAILFRFAILFVLCAVRCVTKFKLLCDLLNFVSFAILNFVWPAFFFVFVYCWLINRSALFLQFAFLCRLDICFLVVMCVLKVKLFWAWLVCNFECFWPVFFFAFFAFVYCWLIKQSICTFCVICFLIHVGHLFSCAVRGYLNSNCFVFDDLFVILNVFWPDFFSLLSLPLCAAD